MLSDWPQFHTHILELEQKGLVTRTFRRLDPERQETILLAILDEATEKEPARLNIKQVAARAGVSVGSLYTYFGNRDGALDFAVETCSRFMVDSFNQYLPYLVALPLRKGLRDYFIGGMEWSQTQTSLVRFFARAAYQGDPELLDRVVRPVADALREMVTAMLEAAAARGEIRSDLDLEAYARVINAMMIAVGDSQLLPYLNAYFQVTGDEMPPGRIQAALVDFILQGVS
jgi:AcrR family transcriptional regulator